MTSPHPPPDPLSSQSDRSASSSSHRPSASAWPALSSASATGTNPPRRGVTPISTSNNPTRPGSSSHSPRNPWSPTNQPLQSSSLSRQPTRSSSISAGTSPFPPPPGQPQPPTSNPSRSRTITAGSNSHPLPFPGSSHSATTSSGSATARLSRASPSISQGSPPASSIGSTAGQSGSLSKITIAQIFLLLSTIKDDDKAKWDSQADQIRKLVDQNGMEVFTKYFRRLVANNALQIFHSARNPDSNSTYPLLVTEVQKISQDPQQAAKVVEAIEYGDGDVFKTFDLSSFMDHFKMKPLAKVALASAFKKSSRTDLRTRADAILSNNLQTFASSLAHPAAPEGVDEPSAPVLASIIDHLAQYPPRSWSAENAQALIQAIQQRYQQFGSAVPTEISASLLLFDLLGPTYPLVRTMQRHGPSATERLDKCKSILETVEVQDISYQQVACVLLFMVIAGDDPAYNPGIFVSALREHRGGQRLDWQDVVHAFDREGVKITRTQFKSLFDALIPLAHEYENFDIQLLWGGDWRHEETQLAFVSAFLSFPSEELDASTIPRLRKAYSIEDFEDASEAVQTYAASAVHHPYVSLDATRALFDTVFRSSDTYASAQSLGVIDNVINANMDLFVCAASAVPKPWGALQDQAMKQLVDPFFTKRFNNYDFVFHVLWKRDRTWLVTRMKQYYQQNAVSIQFVFEHAHAHGWLEYLISLNNEMSIDLAAVAYGRNVFDMNSWLESLLRAMPGPRVLPALSDFLRARAEDAITTHKEQAEPTMFPLAIRSVHCLLGFLGDSGLPEDELITLQRTCIQAYPRLINYGEGHDAIIDANSQDGNPISPDADAMMQEHYKLMYSGEKKVEDIIEVLQKYKTSQDPKEQDLFACMIFGLFDEYNCFGEYPLPALATTSVLFGGIINFHLLSRIALKAALAMVLEAVQDHSPEEQMYKFGLQALVQFQERLGEWVLFCERLLQIPGLQGTKIAEIAGKVVRDHADMPNGDVRDSQPQENNVDNFLGAESKATEFTCLTLDPPLRQDYEEPDEATQGDLLFLLNNLSDRNLGTKFSGIKAHLNEKHNQWFANYIVDQRVKSQPNFQKLYMDLLDRFQDEGLWAEALRETYASSFRLLNAEGTMTSSSDKTHLKNLADWLGSITLARNKPIKWRNLSFKDLLIEAHDTQRLPIAIPFTCRVLTKAADSNIFKPPCAWTMDILEVMMELHRFVELKVQNKFEIERLCSDLGVDQQELEASDAVRSRPAPEENVLPPVGADGIEGFGDMTLMNYRHRMTERFSPSNIAPELSDIPSMLKHNALQSNDPSRLPLMKRIFDTAVERAINEIIGPVVERSVTIAAISTSQLIAKDFALEPSAERYQQAAHTAVRKLAGNLALVTCKEPLRTGIGSNIKAFMARDMPGESIADGTILMFVNDNLDIVCNVIEKAAESASVGEIDAQIEEAFQLRKSGSLPDVQMNRWAFHVPEPYRPQRGGLNREQLAIYEDFGRSVRSNTSHNINASQDGGRQLPDVLQDQYGAMPNMSTPAEAPPVLRQGPQNVHGQNLQSQNRSGQSMVNGYAEPAAIPDRLNQAMMDIIAAATEGAEAFPGRDLSGLDTINQAWKRLQAVIYYSAQASQQDNVALTAARQLCPMLYQDQLPPSVIEVLATVVRLLCEGSEATMRDVLTWIRASEERLLNASAVVALLKADLLDYGYIDRLIATALKSRHPDALGYFGNIIDGVLLSDPPTALRADFAHAMSALAELLGAEPNNYAAQEVSRKLQDSVSLPDPGLRAQPAAREAQAEYVFDEWVKFHYNSPPKGSYASFIQQMHASQVIATRDDAVSFFRVCVDNSIASFDLEASKQVPSLEKAYIKVDALARLILLVVSHQGKTNGSAKSDKSAFFGSIIYTSLLTLVHHYHLKRDFLSQKVFYRLFASILCELNGNLGFSDEEVFEMQLAFAKCMLLVEPQEFPAFAFAWLSLISHRSFMSSMLRTPNRQGSATLCELICCHLKYLGELMKPAEISRGSQALYRGTVEFLLVLHHDFPEFLAENHFQLVSCIPLHCAQMRSLIISAAPSNYPDMADPFANGLKVDRLDEIHRSPIVRGDAERALQDAGMKEAVDAFLQSGGSEESAAEGIVQAASSPTTPLSDSSNKTLSALVIYLVGHAEAGAEQPPAAFNASSPEARLMDMLVERLEPAARYRFINAIVDQLRYPNSHTHYFSYAIFHLFRARQPESLGLDIQMQITRVFVERLFAQRPHAWGLITAFQEILKNSQPRIWDLPFVKAAPELERMFDGLFQQMAHNPRA